MSSNHGCVIAPSTDNSSTTLGDIFNPVAEVIGGMIAEIEAVIEDPLPTTLKTADILRCESISEHSLATEAECEATEQTLVATDLNGDVIQEVMEKLLLKVIEKEDADARVPSPSLGDHMYAKASSSQSSHGEQEKTKKSRIHILAENKRRSTRVKLPTSKHGPGEQEPNNSDMMDHIRDLLNLIPPALSVDPTSEHCCIDRQSDTIADPLPMAESVTTRPFKDESSDVKEFLELHQTNGGVVSTMREWLYTLCDKRMFTWTNELLLTYVKVYEVHRPCYQVPNIFSSSAVERDAFTALIWLEIKLEKSNKFDKDSFSVGRLFEKEITYWELVVGNQEKLPKNCLEFTIRFFYMAAQYFTALAKIAEAINVYNNLLNYLNCAKEIPRVCLCNATSVVVVTKAKVEEERMLLEKAQSLDQLQSVYDSKDYSQVMMLLELTFDLEMKRRFSDCRRFQLGLLLDTVENDANVKDMMRWLADTLQELVYHADSSREGDWAALIIRTLELLNSRLNEVTLGEASARSIVRIVNSCVTVIRVNAGALESEKEMPVETVLPWILLSKLIKLQETKEISTPVGSPSADLSTSLE